MSIQDKVQDEMAFARHKSKRAKKDLDSVKEAKARYLRENWRQVPCKLNLSEFERIDSIRRKARVSWSVLVARGAESLGGIK